MENQIDLMVEKTNDDQFRLFGFETENDGFRCVVEICEFKTKDIAFVARNLERKFGPNTKFVWDEKHGCVNTNRSLLTQVKNVVSKL